MLDTAKTTKQNSRIEAILRGIEDGIRLKSQWLDSIHRIQKECHICSKPIRFWQRSKGLCHRWDYVRSHRRCLRKQDAEYEIARKYF